jgi:hypothetical protein
MFKKYAKISCNRADEETQKIEKVKEKIFNKVKKRWEERVGKGNVDENILKTLVEISVTDDDGKKRVVVDGKTYLVPIEEIFLNGLKGYEITKKYPLEKAKK